MEARVEHTLVMVKPNGVVNGLVGEILSRYEKSGLSVQAVQMKQMTREEAEGFYGEHRGREFFEPLVGFMTSGPTLIAVLGGPQAVRVARAINGATNPEQAEPGTIRFDYAPNTRINVVHSSDSVETAQREIAYWFQGVSLVTYQVSKPTAMYYSNEVQA